MKTNRFSTLFYLSVFVLLNVCNAYGQTPEQPQIIYIPDNGGLLAISKKSEIKFAFDTHAYRNLNAQVKLGYSPLNHFYITTGLFRSQYRHNSLYIIGTTIKDIGVGYYYFFKTQNKVNEGKRKHWMMQNGILVNVLLAYSRGKNSLGRFDDFGFGKITFDQRYIQLGSQFKTNVWGISGAVKLGELVYHKTILRGQATIDQALIVQTLMKRNRYSFVETSFRFFVGTKFGQLNFGLVSTLVGPDFKKMVHSNCWSIGMVMNIRNVFKNLVHRSKRKME